jgi:hypothetical protein
VRGMLRDRELTRGWPGPGWQKLCAAAVALLAPASPTVAQISARQAASPDSAAIVVTVVQGDDQSPLPYALVALAPVAPVAPSPGAPVLHERFANSVGVFRLSGLAPGSYRVRAREIGYAPADTSVTIGPGGVTVTMGLTRVASILPTERVEGVRNNICVSTGVPDSSAIPELAIVFSALNSSVDRFRLLRTEYPFRYELERRRLSVSKSGEHLESQDSVTLDSQRWISYQPGHVITPSFDAHGVHINVYVPSMQDLGDVVFQNAHCYEYGGPDVVDSVAVVRIDFRPRASFQFPDVGGSIYLDAAHGFVRRAVFRLTHPERAAGGIVQLTVTTTFRDLLPNIQVFDRVESDQWLSRSGDVREVETVRFLTYEFQHGAPGS